MTRREECPLCNGDIYPDFAKGFAKDHQTGKKVMVCVECDGLEILPKEAQE